MKELAHLLFVCACEIHAVLILVFLLRHSSCNYLGLPSITGMSLKFTLVQLKERNIFFFLRSQ